MCVVYYAPHLKVSGRGAYYYTPESILGLHGNGCDSVHQGVGFAATAECIRKLYDIGVYYAAYGLFIYVFCWFWEDHTSVFQVLLMCPFGLALWAVWQKRQSMTSDWDTSYPGSHHNAWPRSQVFCSGMEVLVAIPIHVERLGCN